MMGRRFPRPAAEAFRRAADRAAPQTPLAAAQAAWPEVVGAVAAAQSEPARSRGDELIVECASAVWAQELDLMQGQIAARLSERLGGLAPARLRFCPRRVT